MRTAGGHPHRGGDGLSRGRARLADPLGRRLLAALPLLIGASLLTLVLESLGGLRALETAALDLQERLHLGPDASGVALVVLDEIDGRTPPGSKSPLEPARVQEILADILAARPLAVAVDLSTAGPDFASLRPPAGGPPVLWAREATFSHLHRRFRPGPFLGGAHPGEPSGIVAQRVDGDGRIRRYQLLFPTAQGPVPSLPWATVCAVRRRDPLRGAAPGDELFIRFTTRGAPFRLDSSELRRLAGDPRSRQNNPLTGKIVVLGAHEAGVLGVGHVHHAQPAAQGDQGVLAAGLRIGPPPDAGRLLARGGPELLQRHVARIGVDKKKSSRRVF